jgi:hypothetical protein
MASLAGAEVAWSQADAIAATKLACALHVEGPWLAAGRAFLPAEIIAALEDTQLEHAARNAWILSSAKSTSAILVDAKIPHCIVKGVALLPWLAHPGDRWLDDVDFLVPARHRAATVNALRGSGLHAHPHLRHDGAMSDPMRDGASTEWEDPNGVTVDVHFLRAPLPAATAASEDRDGLRRATPAALAVGLSNHVVLHHALAQRFCARHVADLRALLNAGHLDALAEAARTDSALRRSLAYMRSLGARDLHFVAARDLPVGGDMRDHLRAALRRTRSLIASGELVGSLLPGRAYLQATLNDTRASTLTLHWRRWRRIAGRARDGG